MENDEVENYVLVVYPLSSTFVNKPFVVYAGIAGANTGEQVWATHVSFGLDRPSFLTP